MSATLDGEPVVSLNLHLPVNGAWSAELHVASDLTFDVGQLVQLTLPGLDLTALVVRSGIYGERLRVRLTGGETPWGETTTVQHYKAVEAGVVLDDMNVFPDQPVTTQLAFWTRKATTVGENVQAVAQALGLNWRVNPDGTIRMRAEAPEVVEPDAIETLRDHARGIVELSPEVCNVVPGAQVGEDLVGDVLYSFSDAHPLRCRYYTESRARLRGALERLIRWVTRDALYLGTYTAEVISQAGDGTLDLMPDDTRLRGSGLQSVPIRHGLPGVEVDVPAGERVLLAFDGGDPRAPYASLWHEGQVTAIRLGGTEAVALAALVDARFSQLQQAFDAHTHIHAPGPLPPVPTAPPVPLIAAFQPTAAEKLFTS